MPYFLPNHRKRCSPGSKRTSKKGKSPIACKGKVVKRKSPTGGKKRGCTHGRNPKTSKCYSKKAFAARMRSANKRFSANNSAVKFLKKLRSYKAPSYVSEI